VQLGAAPKQLDTAAIKIGIERCRIVLLAIYTNIPI